jgi:hypothetical protein
MTHQKPNRTLSGRPLNMHSVLNLRWTSGIVVWSVVGIPGAVSLYILRAPAFGVLPLTTICQHKETVLSMPR